MRDAIKRAAAAALLLLLAPAAGAADESVGENVVPVLSEPAHRPIFHNDRIDAYDMRLPAGQRGQYHHHSRDQLGILMADHTSFNQPLGGDEVRLTGKRGAIAYVPHTQIGGTSHRVRALEGEMRVIGIEFAAPSPARTKFASVTPAEPGLEFPQGRATRLTLAPGEASPLSAEIVVPMTAGILDDATAGRAWAFTSGQLRWFSAPTSLRNGGSEPIELVVIDLN